MTGETPNPLQVLRELVDTDHHHRCDTHHGGECDCYARRTAPHRAALNHVEALTEAARDVSRIEATGVLPDFQPLADALVPFAAHQNT